MRVIETKVYKLAELTPEAQENARQRYNASDVEWFRADEYMDSLKALAEHFGGELSDWSIDWFGGHGPSSATFEMPGPDLSDESGHDEEWAREKLKELGDYNRGTFKGLGACKLTGCGTDEDAIDGFRIAFMRDGERDLNALMQAAFDSWIEAAHKDYEYDQSMEAFRENCEANEYEFYENGNMIRR